LYARYFITFHLVNDAGVDQTLSSKDLKNFYIFENDVKQISKVFKFCHEPKFAGIFRIYLKK
jgi:hypothetical protein